MSNKNNLIVYCEFEDGKVADVSLELLTKGRQLATTLGVQLEAVVIGDNLKDVEKEIIRYGADTVYKVEDKRLYPYAGAAHHHGMKQIYFCTRCTAKPSISSFR